MESIGVAIAQAGDVREEYRRRRLQGKVLAHQPEGRGVRHCANHVLLQRSQGVSTWCRFETTRRYSGSYVCQDVLRHVFRSNLLDQFHSRDLVLDGMLISIGSLSKCLYKRSPVAASI